MSDKPNPLHAQDAEQALIGCLLLVFGSGGLQAFDAACDAGVCTEAFTDSTCHAVWVAAVDLARSSDYFDSLTLKAKSGITSEQYDKLIDGVPTAAHAPEYAARVVEAYRRRLLRDMARELQAATESPDDNAADIQAKHEARLFAGSDIHRDKATHIHTLAMEHAKFYERALHGEGGIETGQYWLDQAFGGLIGGRVYVISGQPGCGKTTLCRNIAFDVANKGHRTDVLTLELTSEEVAAGVCCQKSGTWMINLDSGKSASDLASYRTAAASMAQLPMHITGGLFTPAKLFSWARRAVANGSRLIVIDYIQRIGTDDARVNDEKRVAAASSTALDIAIKFNVPVLVVSSESNQGNLRYSGQITYDAAGWVRLTMLETQDPKNPQVQATFEKHRHGKTQGSQGLWFNAGQLTDTPPI